MADTDLLFGRPPLGGSPANLLFGEPDYVPDVSAEISGVLPAITGYVLVAPLYEVEISGSLPGISGVVPVTYSSSVQRPTVGQVASDWQIADQCKNSATIQQQEAKPTPGGFEAKHQDATPAEAGFEIKLPKTFFKMRSGVVPRHQDADRVGTTPLASRWQDMDHSRRQSRTARHQDADRLHTSRRTAWQDRYRDRRPSLVSTFARADKSRRGYDSDFQRADRSNVGLGSRFQQAWVPRPGTSTYPPIVVPPEDRCYYPDPNLLFKDVQAWDRNLVFICETGGGGGLPEATVVVPVRRAYIVLNSVELVRVDGGIDLSPYTSNLSLSIDVDSWVWSFSASIAFSQEDNLQPVAGLPVELEATINGNAYRLIVESISRERTFGQASLRVAGRGKAAMLGAPYSPTKVLTPTEARTAAQLMGDLLTMGGVSIGWDIDWGITDWVVPVGAWSYSGSYIEGVSQIAAAAGAYIQPDPVLDKLYVRHRYPVAPWDWDTATPDFELPVAVMTREGIEWQTKPEYNRVFARGVTSGYQGRVTRAGTSGNFAAPMITDPLLTHSDAIAQRGLAVLADTGRQAIVNLRLPVLNETGIIKPGALVRYVDGGVTRHGLVRSTSVEAGLPEVWQTLGVETRA